MKGGAIPAVLALHARELGELWTLRRAALESADFWAEDLLDLERRLVGHWDALAVAGSQAIDVLRGLLAEGDAAIALAAGLTLPLLGGPRAQAAVNDAFATLEGEALDRFAEGLAHAEVEPMRAVLESLAESAEPARAVQAARILAARQGKAPARLRAFIEHSDPAIRLAAWRAVAYTGGDAQDDEEMEA